VVEFRVFSDRVLSMDGVNLSLKLNTYPSLMYARLVNAANDAEQAQEFIFVFRRNDIGVDLIREDDAPPPDWLCDATYRVVTMQTARGRVFHLARIKELDETAWVKVAEFPDAFAATFFSDVGVTPGLVLICGSPRTYRTTTAIAVARHLARTNRVPAFLCERSPLYIFDEETEPYLTQIIGDATAKNTLGALEHRSTTQSRILVIDNAIQRGLAAEALMLASRNYLVFAVVDAGEELAIAQPVEDFCIAATPHEVSRMAPAVARVLRGVLLCSRNREISLGRPLHWYGISPSHTRLIEASDYLALQKEFESANNGVRAVVESVKNVMRFKPRDDG
jgi:DNA polymerase III delta prime subunit